MTNKISIFIITSDNDTVTLTPAMVNAQFQMVDTHVVDSTQEGAPPATGGQGQRKDDMFPYGPRMPPTNIPVAQTGPVPRWVQYRIIYNE